MPSKYFNIRNRRIHTAADTVTQDLLVADTVVEARADGADERSIEGNEDEGLGEHDLLWEDGTSNNSMRASARLHISLYSIPETCVFFVAELSQR